MLILLKNAIIYITTLLLGGITLKEINSHQEIYLDEDTANNLGSDYLSRHKIREYAVMSQVYDVAVNSALRKGSLYVFATTLSVKNFIKVLSEIGISPDFYEVKRIGLFRKLILVKF